MLTLNSSLKSTLSDCRALIISIGLVLLLASCLPKPNTELTPSHIDSEINRKSINYELGNLHYAYSGNEKGIGIIFIHGTPGGWTAFRDYLADPSLKNDYFVVSIDRPGWGDSTIRNKKVETAFANQVKAINALLSDYSSKKWIVVGHSLGASIAPKVALNNDKSIIGIVLLAGSVDPKLGQPRWYNRLANNILVRWLLPKSLEKSNKEIMALRDELFQLNAQIKKRQLDTKLVSIQGSKDPLVSPKNVDYIESEWLNHFSDVKIITLKNEGHFLPWKQQQLIVKEIRSLIEAHQ